MHFLRYLPALLLAGLHAQPAAPEFFEAKIRPVLAQNCYGCHSSKMKSPMGETVLDTKAGLGKAARGKLVAALRYTDPHVQMPPGGKLPDAVIADFAAWVEAGARGQIGRAHV